MKWRDLSAELHQIMAAQAAALDELADTVRGSDLIDARVFVLPDIYPGEELIEPDRIDPVTLSGVTALDDALAGFARFHTGEDLSTRNVWRLPGAVSINIDHPQPLVDQVALINRLRQRFGEITQSVADENERYDLIHHAFPGLVYLQVVRQLRVLQGPVQSVTFSWGRKTGSQLITLASADAKLEWAARNASPALLARTGMSVRRLQETVQREREALTHLPEDTPIRWRRLLRVRPLMNIRRPKDEVGGVSSVIQREAQTPLLLLNAPDARIVPMRSFDANKRLVRQPRSDGGKRGTPISVVLPLFLDD